jgi:branched-chain amino acid transport system permease protein
MEVRRHAGFMLATSMLAVLAGLAAPPLLGTYATEVGFRLLLLIVLAEAWNLLAGYGGLVSLGAASFFGLGCYVMVGMLNQVVANLPLALLASALAGIAMAALASPALFRLRGLHFTVGTLALAEALRLFVVNVPWFGGASGLFIGADLPEMGALFRYGIVLAAVAETVVAFATRSRASVLLRAVRDDEDAAMQMGVRAFRVKLGAFVAASALIAAAGGLQAVRLGTVEPYGSFGVQWSVDALTTVVIGGVGRRFGAIVGAVFVVLLGEVLANSPELHIAITGAVLILVIRCAPRGLSGVVADAFARLAPRTVGREIAG